MRAAILAELQEYHDANTRPPLGPDEFTRRQYQEAAGLTLGQTEGVIKRLVAAGKVEQVGWRLHEGKRVRAYRMCNNDNSA